MAKAKWAGLNDSPFRYQLYNEPKPTTPKNIFLPTCGPHGADMWTSLLQLISIGPHKAQLFTDMMTTCQRVIIFNEDRKETATSPSTAHLTATSPFIQRPRSIHPKTYTIKVRSKTTSNKGIKGDRQFCRILWSLSLFLSLSGYLKENKNHGQWFQPAQSKTKTSKP